MSNMDFPENLLKELLVRLSAESLVRFKRVSKSWSALISSKEFSRMHLNVSLTEPKSPCKVIIRTFDIYQEESRKTFKLLTANFDSAHDFLTTQQEAYHPLQEFNEVPIKIIGSCNGLICIRNDNDGLTLCNPCIKKHIKVPYFMPGSLFKPRNPAYGFGYDDVNDDYKVIKLISSTKVIEIYSLKSNSWIKYHNFNVDIPKRSPSGVFVNSNMHWLHLIKENDENIRFSIVGIDLRTYQYRFIDVPTNLPANYIPKNLGVLNDCLALFSCSKIKTSNSIQVWIMNHYGMNEKWTFLSDIHLGEVVRDSYLYGLRLRPNEEIVFQHSMKEIVWYDMRRQSATKAKIPGEDKSGREVFPIQYSLIDPNFIGRSNVTPSLLN